MIDHKLQLFTLLLKSLDVVLNVLKCRSSSDRRQRHSPSSPTPSEYLSVPVKEQVQYSLISQPAMRQSSLTFHPLIHLDPLHSFTQGKPHHLDGLFHDLRHWDIVGSSLHSFRRGQYHLDGLFHNLRHWLMLDGRRLHAFRRLLLFFGFWRGLKTQATMLHVSEETLHVLVRLWLEKIKQEQFQHVETSSASRSCKGSTCLLSFLTIHTKNSGPQSE